jgi:hypothetical protein
VSDVSSLRFSPVSIAISRSETVADGSLSLFCLVRATSDPVGSPSVVLVGSTWSPAPPTSETYRRRSELLTFSETYRRRSELLTFSLKAETRVWAAEAAAAEIEQQPRK